MINITSLIHQWVACSNELWLKWFNSPNGFAGEFSEVENSLLNAMVIERGGLSNKGVSIGNFYERLVAIYSVSLSCELRQMCRIQRQGNVFCRPKEISVSKGDIFHVKLIESTGVMANGRPYVELLMDDGYILEKIDSVGFMIT